MKKIPILLLNCLSILLNITYFPVLSQRIYKLVNSLYNKNNNCMLFYDVKLQKGFSQILIDFWIEMIDEGSLKSSYFSIEKEMASCIFHSKCDCFVKLRRPKTVINFKGLQMGNNSNLLHRVNLLLLLLLILIHYAELFILII